MKYGKTEWIHTPPLSSSMTRPSDAIEMSGELLVSLSQRLTIYLLRFGGRVARVFCGAHQEPNDV